MILSTNEEHSKPDEIRDVALTTFRSVLFLAFYTDFFGTQYDREKNHDVHLIREMAKDPNIVFVGRLLVKLALIAKINAPNVSNLFYFHSNLCF